MINTKGVNEMGFSNKLNAKEIDENIIKLKEAVRDFKNSNQKFEDYLPMFSTISKLYKQFDYLAIRESHSLMSKIKTELNEVINEPVQLELPLPY